MIRRFVNIVTERGSSGLYSLHRLDVFKHLFYPSKSAAEEANKKNENKSVLPWLPLPIMRFQPSPTPLQDTARMEMFALLSPRSSDDKIICCNSAGHTMLYNAESGCIQSIPPLNGDKGSMPMAISIAQPGAPEDDIYVMSTTANMGDKLSYFDVLRLGSSSSSKVEHPMCCRGWHWDPLPPLPASSNICSHTVVDGGNTICVSTVRTCGGGTYCFDTVKFKWWKAGDWVLPFDGAAEYIADLKLWMGFSSDNEQLCAWDLSAMDKPPTLLHSWTDLETPEHGSASRLSLLNLGAGRFCIAKVFRFVGSARESFDWGGVEDKCAVLTGVEIVNSTGAGGNNNPGEGLQIVKHKSIRYRFTDDIIRWIL